MVSPAAALPWVQVRAQASRLRSARVRPRLPCHTVAFACPKATHESRYASDTRAPHAAGQRAGELEMLHSIKTSQEQGHTFTEWVHKFNGGKGSDTTHDGSHLAGSRMHKQSRQAKAWEQKSVLSSISR